MRTLFAVAAIVVVAVILLVIVNTISPRNSSNSSEKSIAAQLRTTVVATRHGKEITVQWQPNWPPTVTGFAVYVSAQKNASGQFVVAQVRQRDQSEQYVVQFNGKPSDKFVQLQAQRPKSPPLTYTVPIM